MFSRICLNLSGFDRMSVLVKHSGWARVKKCNLLTILSSSRIVPNEVEGQFARAQKLYG